MDITSLFQTINHPWQVYKKSSNGRIIYYHYSDDRVVSSNNFPPNFDIESIEWCDERLDDARKLKKLREAHEKLIMSIATSRVKLTELQSCVPPENYELYIQNYQNFMASSQDFYKKIDARGTTRYFSKKTDKQVNKNQLPATLNMVDVPIRTQGIIQAIEFRKITTEKIPKAETQIKNLCERLAVIEKDISGLPDIDYTTILKTHADKANNVIARENAARKRNLDELLKHINHTRHNPQPPPRPTQPPPRPTTQTIDKDEAEKILKTFNITTKLEWKKWLVKHHSDKGGSHILTQEVINAGKLVYDS